jgi:mevalonate kinase
MTSASAPGKIILFGEHAVVYNRPALAVPVMQVQAYVKVSDSHLAGIWIDAPDVSLHADLSALPVAHPLATAIRNTLQAAGVTNPPPLKISVTSTIPVASGLGSGAAVSVAIIRALSAHLDCSFDNQQVSSLCYETEKLHHGTPSGIDNTVITYARPVYFVRGQPIQTFSVAHPFTIEIGRSHV